MLQGDTLKYNEAITCPPQSSNKRPVTISYDLTDATPLTPKKNRGKTPPTQNSSDSHNTKVTDSSSTTFLKTRSEQQESKKINHAIIETRNPPSQSRRPSES